jgi:hypothetical protein
MTGAELTLRAPDGMQWFLVEDRYVVTASLQHITQGGFEKWG